jgi:oxidase EvaA
MITRSIFADTCDELKSFLTSVIRDANFSLVQVQLKDQTAWRLDKGALSHTSNGFFHVCGLEHESTREQKLVLFQPQSALTGLALYKKEGKTYVLLQARIEPGNTNIGQFGPTIQSTPANYLRMHGGKATACVDWFTQYKPGFRQIDSSMQFDIGERYFQKSKFHNYVEVDQPHIPDPSMIWASLNAIFAALQDDHFLNADLRSLLSVFDWSHDHSDAATEMGSISEDESRFMQGLLNGKNSGAEGWQLIDLQQLTDWTVNNYGIEDKTGKGIDVAMYKTDCTTREVVSWVQPLLRAKKKGLVRLLIRDTAVGELECLVTLAKESGICGGQTILPSMVVYPGDYTTLADIPLGGIELAAFDQSDEGGRFIHHESTYQVLKVESCEMAPNQYWVSLQFLQKILATSNQASFQLRCCMSALLPQMHPQLDLSICLNDLQQ